MKQIIKEAIIGVTIAVILAGIGLLTFYVMVGWPLRSQDAVQGYEAEHSPLSREQRGE